jgi:hypothetical protein
MIECIISSGDRIRTSEVQTKSARYKKDLAKIDATMDPLGASVNISDWNSEVEASSCEKRSHSAPTSAGGDCIYRAGIYLHAADKPGEN